MKSLKRILHTCLVLILMAGCTTDDNNLDFLDDVEAPSNVSALFQPTQDNSGERYRYYKVTNEQGHPIYVWDGFFEGKSL